MSDQQIGSDRNQAGRFISGNPGGGRPPGSRPKLAERYVQDVQREWEKRGPEALSELTSSELCMLVSKIIPKDFNISVDVDIGDFAGKFRAALEALHGDDMPVIEAKPLKMLKNVR